MKIISKLTLVMITFSLLSCGGKEEKSEEEQITIGDYNKTEKVKEPINKSEKPIAIDLNNKGIGPIKNLSLPDKIDNSMVVRGEALFKSKCMACHKPYNKFIGPPPAGILEKRSPEWIMNMILNPEEMTQKDPIAKQLLLEHNNAPMANQSLTEKEARDILEYFRTLKEKQ